MAIEVGDKVVGKVSGITNFGAFVDLDDNQTGLVHISQISDSFVKDIHDVLSVGDSVTVKVMKIGDDGKIALSMKAALPEAERHHEDHGHGGHRHFRRDHHDNNFHHNHEGHGGGFHGRPNGGGHGGFNNHHSHRQNEDFNDMLADYMKESESRLSTLKRQTDGKRGGRGGRRR
ncbi:S1 domain-containing RNA-binding protein [uncultured Limosilactobacillus sp.]|uniref:S1 domain-containing RNA-binding protein n=1 Tax=uncultured Limosilactobacillus sp. TaxID=2837629 RepID=UPI0025F92EAF|nr:S1 domain-containing RNA-binding protein [uncultured Limosilactobacillus sp.]